MRGATVNSLTGRCSSVAAQLTIVCRSIAAAADGIFDVFPNGIEFTIKDMVAEGNKVAVEASSSGEHVSGQTYANQYHFLFEIIDGKLKSLKEYLDTEVVTDVLCGGQRPPFGDA